MTTPSFSRLASLFHRASRLRGEQRRALLDAAGASRPEVRSAVSSLLRHGDRPHELMETGGILEILDRAAVPERLGPYRLLEKLGEGGMGIVYCAEQDLPIRRHVAIKLVKGVIASRESIMRLESERRALALMNHPNVARVFDAGATPGGQPYVVMELVAGQSITSYCNINGVGLRGRLELMIDVCRGVQHAHNNAIIHRDIKPSNVLVTLIDGRPMPKIIDFGVSKILDPLVDRHRLTTATGQWLGTPEYVSPEQSLPGCESIDTRSDVYSLGVLLYELLAGRRPFALGAGDLESLLRRIREEQPPRPSTIVPSALARHVRGDLDWIVTRALEKEPSRRYASPADLAEDIGRHLRLEPVQARPPNALYRIGRLFRRHRAAATLTLALLMSVVGFTALTAMQSVRVAREAQRAEKEATAKSEVVGFLLELFAARPEFSSRTSPKDVWLSDIHEKIRSRLKDQPILRARILGTIGDSYLRMSTLRDALPLLEEAHADLLLLAGENHQVTLDAAQSLGRGYLNAKRYEEAERLLLHVNEKRIGTLGAEHPSSIESSTLLGYLYKTWGRNEAAAERLQSTIATARRAFGDDDPRTLTPRGYLAGVLLEQRRFGEAAVLLEDLVEMLGARGLTTSVARYNLGCAHANLGNREKAFEHLAAAVESGFSPPGSIRQDPLLHPLRNDPALAALEHKVRFHDFHAWPRLLDQAQLSLTLGRYDQAEITLFDILSAVRRTRGDDLYYVLRPMLLLADLRLRQGRYEEAEVILLERLQAVRDDPRVNQSQVALTLRYRIQSRIGQGDKAGALRLLRQMLEANPLLAWQGQEKAYVAAMQAGIEGDRQTALDSLTLAVDRGYDDHDWLSRDLCFRWLRGDPAFEAIRRRVARQWAEVGTPPSEGQFGQRGG